MEEKRRYKLMSFGLGGNMGYIALGKSALHPNGGSCTSSWYIKPDELQRYICNDHYPAEEMEGCLLVDNRALFENDPALAIKGPMCDARLKDDQEDRFDPKQLEDPIIGAICNEVTQCHEGKLAIASIPYGGLDTISPKKYFEYWKAQGARVGVIVNGKVNWD